jgi:hypothetical protein
MSNYLGGANVTNTVRLFLLNDPAFVTYMVLLAAVLGFAALVRHMGVIRATVFSRATVGVGFLLWLNALSVALENAFRCIGGGCE